MEYTTQQIKEILGWNFTYSLSTEQFIKRSEKAGLIIELVGQSKKGKTNKYKIIEDKRDKSEEWVQDPINPSYICSKQGTIKNKKTKRIVGQGKNEKGYLVAIDENNNNIVSHRHIFFAFHPELWDLKDKIVVDHINGIRTDNRLENLRPLTLLENTKERDKNQTKIQTLTTQLILKYGYEETLQLLKNLL